jgi:hypothetical protein
MMLQYIHLVVSEMEKRRILDKDEAIKVRVNFQSTCRVPSMPFGTRGHPRSGFARRGEKIAYRD